MPPKLPDSTSRRALSFEMDPLECPFREFRDNELHVDGWGLGTAAFGALMQYAKVAVKTGPDLSKQWVDDQTQPLPRSVRKNLHGWVRAEKLANDRFEADLIVAEDDPTVKMVGIDFQLSHAQVLQRSSFCRRVLSICFLLERVEGLIVEHQWDNFMCSFPEGWRAKYHIYSPGLKPGGGPQHKPQLSKSGCYLVRLFFLGAWRCVWVSDQVPVDVHGAPLLPFSPMVSRPSGKPGAGKPLTTVTSNQVYLWPLLICKALLKLAAPDMNSDEDSDCTEDEPMDDFDILASLTGCLNLIIDGLDADGLWNLITEEVPVFAWDDDDETLPSTVKSRSTKKATTKESSIVKRSSMLYVIIKDSEEFPAYYLPGVTPAHEMELLITMARDLPLKKPLPEPEVALWKVYRWIDWARRHGLYETYECPRTKFLKISGLLRLSHAPHLLDVMSTESITMGFVEEHKSAGTIEENKKGKVDKRNKEQIKLAMQAAMAAIQQSKEELREWIQFMPMCTILKDTHVVYYPSMFEHCSAGSNPPQRFTKTPGVQIITGPKCAPLYLQIDGPEENVLKISLRTLNPRILSNSGVPVLDYIEPAHLLLEVFEWFKDTYLPKPKGFLKTPGYDTVEVKFRPGRHVCRAWVHSRMNWHVMLLSESTVLLGSRDVIMGASVRECPWASKFLLNLGTAFSVWAKVSRNSQNVIISDREFFRSYLPDLTWDKETAGCGQALVHWMFRRALQAHLVKRLHHHDYKVMCSILRRYFNDPDFGFPEKPRPRRPFREIAKADVCDCVVPEAEEVELFVEEEEINQSQEEKQVISADIMEKLLLAPKPPAASQICEIATEEFPCGVLKEEREKQIRRHEAAAYIQALWRGTWARKVLRSHATFGADSMKIITEYAFGNVEILSKLMNEFFFMFPGTKHAYSVSSALSGVYGVQQHIGLTPVTPKCKWIPYFQGVFFCHTPVKVHFDVGSTISHCSLAVYDNDNGEQFPQAYNAHITFDFVPNYFGYTITGHGTLVQNTGSTYDAHWQLTVLSSIDGAFHICDNEDPCRELPLTSVSKLHLDEVFLPNRRNIMGGIQLAVSKHESVSFRCTAASPDLEIEVTLRSISADGQRKVVSKCSGKGEIFWPYIRLEPNIAPLKAFSISQRDITIQSSRTLNQKKSAKLTPAYKMRSTTKMKQNTGMDSKMYSLEAVCPRGWPLTLAQWQRVNEIRNMVELKVDLSKKQAATTPKPGSAKDKDKEKERPSLTPFQPALKPQPGDAYVILECAVAVGGGATAKRDDERDLEFANARKFWDMMDPGRNQKGAMLRKEFRNEFLEAPPIVPSRSFSTPTAVASFEETEGEAEQRASTTPLPQGPSPATESGLLEGTVESEEESSYLAMPDMLRDKFIPLYFLPFCMKEKEDESVLVTPDMAEAAKKDRSARIDAAKERQRELQAYNEEHVLARQKMRCQRLEKLLVDSQWPESIVKVFQLREDAIAQETLIRTLSATKKNKKVTPLDKKVAPLEKKVTK